MLMSRHGRTAQVLWLAAAMTALTAVAGCDVRPTAPETRAERFVEKMLRAPQALDELRALTELPAGAAPEDLVNDLQTRTAVTYLRARSRLGAELAIRATGSSPHAPAGRRVEVVVSEGLAVRDGQAVHFFVDLHQTGDEWFVTGLRSD